MKFYVWISAAIACFVLQAFLKIENVGREGTVRIYGMYSQMYIAMDEKGRLVPVANQTNATLFEEARHYNYNTYLSLMNAHKGWYLGIKKNGKFKNGQKNWPQTESMPIYTKKRKI